MLPSQPFFFSGRSESFSQSTNGQGRPLGSIPYARPKQYATSGMVWAYSHYTEQGCGRKSHSPNLPDFVHTAGEFLPFDASRKRPSQSMAHEPFIKALACAHVPIVEPLPKTDSELAQRTGVLASHGASRPSRVG